jgi:hypothetical protein
LFSQEAHKQIKALKPAQRKALLRKYKEHLQACRNQGCDPHSILDFLVEIRMTPPEVQRELWAESEGPEEYAPFMKYDQYTSPKVLV